MKRFGLIGDPLEHSFSARYFKEKFERENISDCRYDLFPLSKVSEIRKLISAFDNLAGFNVTIPHKTSIIPLLDELDQSASAVGAVNTVKIFRKNNALKLKGFNTDTWGFENSTDAFEQHIHALILGTGGAAKAIAFVLKSKNIDFLMVSRNPKEKWEIRYDQLTEPILSKYLWIINTTPLGMFPDTKAFPPIPYHLLTPRHFLYDLIYNPTETIFLAKGNQAGAKTMNGLLMLELQAEKAWEIWNND